MVAAAVISISTPNGTLVVDVPEGLKDDIRVEVTSDGASVTLDKQNGWTAKLDEGDWDVKLDSPSDSFALDKGKVTIRSGEHQMVSVTYQPQDEGKPSSRGRDRPAKPIALADPDTAESAHQAGLYTWAYQVPDDGVVSIRRARWKVKNGYRGHNGEETLVDGRIRLYLDDEDRSFWPVLCMLSSSAAEALHGQLVQLIESAPAADPNADEHPEADAKIMTAPYATDSIGRVQLPAGMAWEVREPPAEGARPQLVLRDQQSGHDAAIVDTPWDAVRRLSDDLGAAVKRQKMLRLQKLAFQTRDGFWVRAVRGGGGDVRADASERKTSEVFTVEWINLQRTNARIRTREGYYLAYDSDARDEIYATTKSSDEAGIFTFEWLDAGRSRARIAFCCGGYLHAVGGGGGDLDGKVDEPKTSEVFTVAVIP